MNAGEFILAGARGIEPRSKVLETFILAVVLCPFTVIYYNTRYCNRYFHTFKVLQKH